jgi:hypothetical protein
MLHLCTSSEPSEMSAARAVQPGSPMPWPKCYAATGPAKPRDDSHPRHGTKTNLICPLWRLVSVRCECEVDQLGSANPGLSIVEYCLPGCTGRPQRSPQNSRMRSLHSENRIVMRGA